jgi:uncharacterized membrane protein
MIRIKSKVKNKSTPFEENIELLNDRSMKRIFSLTDATFGVAMTILILSVDIPFGLSDDKLHEKLFDQIFPALFVYILSFIILGAFWNETHYHNHLIFKSDVVISWLYIFFLMFICMIPFSSSFVIHYPNEKRSVLFYLLNVLVANITNLLIIIYTWINNYTKPGITDNLCKNIIFRIAVPSLFYILFIPFAFFNHHWVLFVMPLPMLLQILLNVIKKRII